MTEDELTSILAAHARDFANRLIETFRDSPLEEIAAFRGVTVHLEEPVALLPPAPPPLDENEVSILEHINGAGPKGSTLRAWIISTQGELEPDEHAAWESKGKAILDALVDRGTLAAKDGGKMRGTVYTLLPV